MSTSKSKAKVSVCVITLNEQQHITRCLQSLIWTDDRVVVDCGSTDQTVELAKACGARVIQQEWLGYGLQKQFAVNQALHDWVLCLDADEWVDSELSSAIQSVLASEPNQLCGFQVTRRLKFLGRWLHHGNLGRDRQLRLFHRSHAQWRNRIVHESVEPPNIVRSLPGYLLHAPKGTLETHMFKLHRYAILAAEEMRSNGQQSTLIGALLHTAWSFLRDYIIKCGFLDGSPGLLVAIMHAGYVFQKHALNCSLSEIVQVEKGQI